MKKKVLHISCGGLGHGGVSSVIFSIVEPLKEEFDFGCVVFKKKCDQEERFEKCGKLYRIDAYSIDGKRNYWEIIKRPFALFFGIYKICKKEKYDVVHAHNNDDEALCLLAAKLAGVPIRIAHSHNTKSPQKQSLLKRIIKSINRKMIRRTANRLVGCSQEACRAYFGDAEAKVVYNAIDLQTYNIRNKKEHEGLAFIHVGRYTYQKNQVFIIDIFKHLHVLMPEANLSLVGFGEDKAILQQKIKEYKLQDCCTLIPGDIVNIPECYAKSDYMIFPSRFEGFGIVLLEAQAMGIECFVSEAIQKDVDLGLLHYLSLSDPSEKWAEEIVAHIKKRNNRNYCPSEERLQEYSIYTISKRYANLYINEKE